MVAYSMLVQASPEEILHASSPEDLNLAQLRQWPTICRLLVMLPELDGCDAAVTKLKKWGYQSFVGDPYNVCRRAVAAQKSLDDQTFAVRVLAIWKHLDLAYVDLMVAQMREEPCDAVLAPRDFDITFASDIASLQVLEKIGSFPGETQAEARAKFNPWGYMDMYAEQFNVRYAEPAPLYGAAKRDTILATPRCHPENEFVGRDYAGSRYHFFAPMIPPGLRILDIACGSGEGAYLLSQHAELVLGVDYLDVYVDKARERFSENEHLAFRVGDGQNFNYDGRMEWFDIVVSLHTLEHVPDDKKMLENLASNLKPGGLLVVEVPLLMPRPLGVPVNPYHLREYRQEVFLKMLSEAGFEIEHIFGGGRNFYGDLKQARDAIHVHARKPSN